jgi:hypothetical protein
MKLHDEMCQKAKSIMQKKNHDYATGGNNNTDPFANFRLTERVLDIPAELGLMTRVLDKIQRIKTYVKQGKLAVENEGVNDAILDILNYMVLLQGIINERSEKK